MRIIISGYKGFIGSHLYDRLSGKHELLGLDKKERTSTSNPKTIKKIRKFKPDLIVHMGANCSSQKSLRDPRMNFEDNTIGTFNVCEIARELNIPVIFNSSMKVRPGTDGITTPYGISKIEGEMYLDLYHHIYGIDYIVNRPSCVYGPRQDGSDDGAWVSWFIKAKLTNQNINLYGGGVQSRDILYIDDHVDLLIDQIDNFDKYKNEAYDIGGGKGNLVTLLRMLEFLEYKRFTDMPILPGDIDKVVCDNKKVREVNGWEPKTPWVIGVNKTLLSMLKNV